MKTNIPEWLLERGLQENHGITLTKQDLLDELKRYEKELKKAKTKERKRYAKAMIKYTKRDIRRFKIDFFTAEDIEELFEKYDLIDKNQMIFRPRPQDIGKKRFICNKCGKRWWRKTKPRQCKCGSKDILIYYRL